MARVLFRVWFSIQGIIQNTTCSVRFRIQRITEKYPGYYSASGSLFRVLFKIRPAASGSGFSVLFIIRPAASGSLFRVLFKIRPEASGSGFRSVWFRIQRIIQNMTCSVWFIIQGIIQSTTCSVSFSIQGIIQNTTCSVWSIIQGIIQKWPGYYSAYGSVFRVLFEIRPAAFGSGFSVLLKKNIQGIIQRLVHYSGYYSKYDLQRLVHYSGYY